MTPQTTLSGPFHDCHSQDPTCCIDFSHRQKSTFIKNRGFEAGGAGCQSVGETDLWRFKANKSLARAWPMLRGGGVNPGHRYEVIQGSSASSPQGTRIKPSLFIDVLALLLPLQWSFHQRLDLERRQEANSLSPTTLVY